jgi:hypothetical protein
MTAGGSSVNRLTDHGIWIESGLPLAGTTEWSIPLRLIEAVAVGKPANLGNVPAHLASHLLTIRDILAAWIDGHRIPLEFALLQDEPPAASGVSLFYSGGVDSCYSLIRHRDQVDNLILVHGFDVPLADTATFALAEARARDVAGLFGKRLIIVRTNVHFEQPSNPCRWWFYIGAALAAVAHALAPNHGKVYIAASYSYTSLHGSGSHPLLDPLWSTRAVQIVHDGVETRIEKLRVLAQHPEVLARVRVCWQNKGGLNCCRCEKCVRTMLGLRALGIDPCPAFPGLLSPELVRRQQLDSDDVAFWRELLSSGLPPALHAAVRSALASYDAGLPPSAGVRGAATRWCHALRHAGRELMAPLEPGKSRLDLRSHGP